MKFNNKATEQQSYNIINWRQFSISPADILGLKKPFTIDDVHKAFAKHSPLFNPETYAGQQKLLIEMAYQVLCEARDYLLYTLQAFDGEIHNNSFRKINELHHPMYTEDERAYENLLRQLDVELLSGFTKTYFRNNQTIRQIREALQKNPELLYYTVPFPSYKHITYLAAQVGDKDLFSWLLDQGALPTIQTDFGMSAIDIAFKKNHDFITGLLQCYYGDERFKVMLEEMLTTCELKDVIAGVIEYYSREFKEITKADFMQYLDKNCYLISVGHQFNFLSKEEENQLAKAKIVGQPTLYTQLNEDLREDPFLIVAALVQTPSLMVVSAIPFKKLDPYFICALASLWPSIELIATQMDILPWQYSMAKSKNLFGFSVTFGLHAGFLALAVALSAPPIFIAYGIISSMVLLCLELTSLYCKSHQEQQEKQIHILMQQNRFFRPTLPPNPDDDVNEEAEEQVRLR